MKTSLSFLLLLWNIAGPIAAQSLSKVGPGYSLTSVNTAIFRQSSIVTHGDTQYIAYYDTAGYLTLGKRLTGTDEWTLRPSPYKGHCEDAHNVISIGIDGDGFLHVAFDHHGQKLNYCRSLRPGGLELGRKQPMTGLDEDDVTYPEFYRLPGGDLLFAYRSGASGRGNLVLNRYLTRVKQWARLCAEQPILIDGENRRNAYWQLTVDAKGTIHVSWVWRETWLVETNHDLCYARSRDGGKTWEKSTGEPYALPITVANAEYIVRIPQGSELINQTSMSTDREGRPYIATYWREAGSRVPQYRIVYRDSAGWQVRQVSDRATPFTLAGGGTKRIPIARPRLVADTDTVSGFTRIGYIFRDEERGNRVSIAETGDLHGKAPWIVRDLTAFPVDAWEPAFDPEQWQTEKHLHLFVQRTAQGDGEQVGNIAAQPVYVLEYKPFNNQ